MLGPIRCGVHVDTIGCTSKLKLYAYKGKVNIPPLKMIDDIAAVSLCGLPSLQMNNYVNRVVEMKKLRFNVSKCKKIHLGQKNLCCPQLHAHNQEMNESNCEKYVGDMISENCTIGSCINYRVSKGMGIIAEIMTLLDEITLGSHYFEVAMELREAIFLNGILFNSEVWYGVNDKQVEQLEQVDEMLLRKLLKAKRNTPKVSLYLELGCIPIRFRIMSRRLMFLQYLLSLDKDSLLYRVFSAQRENPVRDDWVLKVQEDITFLGFDEEISLEEVNISKKVIKDRICKAAFRYLMLAKDKHSKMSNLTYRELNMQKYLKEVSKKEDCQQIFKFRTRMIDVKENFKNQYVELLCPLCTRANDSQEHLLACTENTVDSQQINYKDIFGDDTPRLLKCYKCLMEAFEKREQLLEEAKV